jgi:hypothetical protein
MLNTGAPGRSTDLLGKRNLKRCKQQKVSDQETWVVKTLMMTIGSETGTRTSPSAHNQVVCLFGYTKIPEQSPGILELCLVRRQGLEPRLMVPETIVLPLDDLRNVTLML